MSRFASEPLVQLHVEKDQPCSVQLWYSRIQIFTPIKRGLRCILNVPFKNLSNSTTFALSMVEWQVCDFQRSQNSFDHVNQENIALILHATKELLDVLVQVCQRLFSKFEAICRIWLCDTDGVTFIDLNCSDEESCWTHSLLSCSLSTAGNTWSSLQSLNFLTYVR